MLTPVVARGLKIAEDGECRRRNLVPLHESLRKGFRRFDFCGEFMRSEYPDALVIEAVGKSGFQRGFRADNDHINQMADTKLTNALHVGRRVGQILRQFSRAGITGRAIKFFNQWRLMKLPHQSVFTGTRTNH